MRAELNSLDPAFFEEVEDLKCVAATTPTHVYRALLTGAPLPPARRYRVHAQAELLSRYEALLRQYADALGVPFHAEPRP